MDDPIVTISIVGDTFDIHVTSGNGKGTAIVMSKLALVTKKSLAVFAPEMTRQARANVEALDIKCFSDQEEMIQWIKATH